MEAKKVDDGYQIGKNLFWSSGTEVDKDRISLLSKKGEIMNYGERDGAVVDFPGEYDIQGIGITCLEAEDLLHYIVKLNGKQVALIQDKEAFELATFDDVDQWFVTSKEIEKELQSLELEGDVEVLD